MSGVLTRALPDWPRPDPAQPGVIGVLPGEGIGPDVVAAALEVLGVVCEGTTRRFDLRRGGVIGNPARKLHGKSLSDETVAFCEDVFAARGALFCGPGGARFVYELRDRFDLYCKFTPLQPTPALRDAGPLRPEIVADVDVIAVRENIGGLYFGQWGRGEDRQGRPHAFHSFDYRQDQVDRILDASVKLAALRQKRLCLVIKREGTPAIAELWVERAQALVKGTPVKLDVLDIDNAVYQLVANPRQFDVFVSSNMFGDVLADTGSAVLASRGMSYSGNYGPEGRASYQTGHGAAYDLTGAGTANPCGQILSLAMMLEESFDWSEGARRVRAAVAATLTAGWRTADVAGPGSRVVGTQALAQKVCEELRKK